MQKSAKSEIDPIDLIGVPDSADIVNALHQGDLVMHRGKLLQVVGSCRYKCKKCYFWCRPCIVDQNGNCAAWPGFFVLVD